MTDDDYIDVDEHGNVVQPTQPTTALATVDNTYRPSLVLQPEQAGDLVRQIKEVQRSVLVAGTDYGQIPGVRGNPVLLKPGAERLLQVFGLGHSLDRVEDEPDPEGGHWAVTYRCTITKAMPDGRVIVISTCEGHASYDEDKFWDAKWEGPKGNRKQVGRKKSPWNTVLKMAQKRALVGATLTATATSGLFTQDMEDYALEHPLREQTRPTAAPPAEPEDPNAISPQQVKLVNVLMVKAGIDERDEKLGYCAQVLGRAVSSSKDMTKKEASMVIDALKLLVGEE